MSDYNPITGLYASIGSGVSNAVLFNWFDQAQYLSIKNHRSFFNINNFMNPMQGTLNSSTSKILSNGMYFFCIDYFRNKVNHFTNLNDPTKEFLAGNMSGITIAVIANPMSAVKYRNWDKQWSTAKITKSMYQTGGIKSFLKGTMNRIYRDSVFSTIYVMSRYYGRQYLEDSHSPWLFLSDNIAIICATIVSSPFNYSLNKMYAVKPHHPYPSTYSIFMGLYNHVKVQERPLYTLYRRLHIGVGVIRVSIGMSISHRMYDYLYAKIDGYRMDDIK